MANWRLLGFSAVLGLGVPLLGFIPELSRIPVQGRAQLVEPLPLGQGPAWQVVFDPVALGLSKPASFSWLDDGESLRSAIKKVFQLDATADELTNSEARTVQISGTDFQARPNFKFQPSIEPANRHPLFVGTPIVAGEWADQGNSVRFQLYRSPQFGKLLSGRVAGKWSLDGFRPTGEGFALTDIQPLPRKAAQVVSVDSSAIKFPQDKKAPLNEALKRWELPNVDWALERLGPDLTYLQWQDNTFFSFGLRDPQAIQDLSAKRYPPAAVPTSVQRVGGVRIQGFDPDGPAWAFRGDRVFASREGGTEQLGRFVEAALSARSSSGNDFWSELERLAETEPGWHLLIAREETKQGPPWAALLRWSSDSQLTGYLVVKPDF